MIPYPEAALVRANRALIRHEADVPVLLSAIAAKPDWLLTHNTKHFTQAVAVRCGLRIATPVKFFTILSSPVSVALAQMMGTLVAKST